MNRIGALVDVRRDVVYINGSGINIGPIVEDLYTRLDANLSFSDLAQARGFLADFIQANADELLAALQKSVNATVPA